MCDVNSMVLQIAQACVILVGLLKNSQPKLTEIFHRTFYMEVHNNIFLNVALVCLLAIQVMIVKRSQDVSY